jgi:hypothetical protein
MEEYAKFLEKYGKKERVVSLYEEMICLSFCFPKKKRAFIDKLASALTAAPSTFDYE